MVVMELGDLLTEVSIFLRVTLAEEKLSDHAQLCRQKLICRLVMRDGSPPTQAYIDMNGSSFIHPKLQTQISDCYEEFSSSLDLNDSSKEDKDPKCFMNNMYNNLEAMKGENLYLNNGHEFKNKENLKPFDEGTYIHPTSHIANTPVVNSKPSLPSKSPSKSNSERNSIISIKKDSPERLSDSSSFSSSSTRCDEYPEVSSISASALRYAATKSGILGRRERFLFVDHTKQYWAAILNQNLFLFSSDKDCKPVSVLDVTGYKARPVAISNTNKLDFKIELVSPGKKTYQFVTEKQSDMETWIAALNVATRPMDMSRHLLGLEMYDQPDSAVRPIVEAEYELPDAIIRRASLPTHTNTSTPHHTSRTLTNQFISPLRCTNSKDMSEKRKSPLSYSPKETRKLPSLPIEQETYDQPEPLVRPVAQPEPELYESLREELYHSIDDQPEKPKDSQRRLPLLPHELETYDQPDSCIRPVSRPSSGTVVQEEFYSIIDNNSEDERLNKQVLYKNTENHRNEDNENYYNLVPYPEAETDQECIYDVIIEQRLQQSPSPTPTKSDNFSSIRDEIKLMFEKKKVSNSIPVVFTKPQLRAVKPPIVSKTCQ